MRLVPLTLLFSIALCANAQDPVISRQFSDLFTVKMIQNEDARYISFDPDSMADPMLQERCTMLWPALMYMHSIYSEAYGLQFKLEELLPDIDRVRNELSASLNADTAFQTIYLRSINRTMVPPIGVDSLMSIVSRFFYVHRVEGKVVQHICVGMNEVLDLPQSLNTPYYNAFAYLVVYGLEDPFKLIREAVGDDVEELRRPITDERLRYFTDMVYSKLEANRELRDAVIRAYEERQDHLNFQLLR
jgi:hypothetical protein